MQNSYGQQQWGGGGGGGGQPSQPGQQQQQQQQQGGRGTWNGGGGAGPAVAGAGLGLPDVPTHFAELDGLSFDQLEALEDAAKFHEFFEQLPQVQQLKQAESAIQQENQALAQANLAKQPELERAKQELLGQHAQLAERKAKYDELVKRQDELAKDLSVESIKAQLAIATREAKDEATGIADKFKEGALSVDEFMKQFKTAAERHHMRKNKTDSFKLVN